jgi:hypothetical protein
MRMSWTLEEVKIAVLLCLFIFPFIFVLWQLFKVSAEAAEAEELERLQQEKGDASKQD